MQTFLFPSVLQDYTAGCAIARATSKEDAIILLVAKMNALLLREYNLHLLYQQRIDIKHKLIDYETKGQNPPFKLLFTQNKTEKQIQHFNRSVDSLPCRLGTCGDYTVAKFENELRNGPCYTFKDDKSFAFFVGGGS